MFEDSSTQPTAESPSAFGSRAVRRTARKQTRSRRSISGKPSGAARVGRYGGLAVSAWLLTAVATGHGVAAADDSPSSPSPTGSSSKSSSTSTSSDTKRPLSATSSTRDGRSRASFTASKGTSDDASTSASGTTSPSMGSTTSTAQVGSQVKTSSSIGAQRDSSFPSNEIPAAPAD